MEIITVPHAVPAVASWEVVVAILVCLFPVLKLIIMWETRHELFLKREFKVREVTEISERQDKRG